MEVPEVGSSISTISFIPLYMLSTYPSRPLRICMSIYLDDGRDLSFTFHLVLTIMK